MSLLDVMTDILAKVFSLVLVRKCGNFQIPRIPKIPSARIQVML